MCGTSICYQVYHLLCSLHVMSACIYVWDEKLALRKDAKAHFWYFFCQQNYFDTYKPGVEATNHIYSCNNFLVTVKIIIEHWVQFEWISKPFIIFVPNKAVWSQMGKWKPWHTDKKQNKKCLEFGNVTMTTEQNSTGVGSNLDRTTTANNLLRCYSLNWSGLTGSLWLW